MLKSFLITLLLPLTLLSQTYGDHVKNLYNKCELEGKLSYKVFSVALTGYYNLKYNKKISGDKLVIVDFRQSSSEERFYVIDLDTKELLYKTLVAHGKNSGGNYAFQFSNKKGSYKSSLGFYITTKTYEGCNGLSLYLNGIDKGYNTNAKERLIVVHGADYITKKEMGHSKGCLALSMRDATHIIPIIKNGNCIFGYATSYHSNLINPESAIHYYEQIQIGELLEELLKSNHQGNTNP